jgi:hypothetical protein
MKSLRSIIGALVVISVLQSGPAVAQESGGGNQELARAAQNPVGDLISLPFQNNMLNDDWNLITRTILPVMSSPFPGDDRTNGIGDLNFTGFFSPSAPGKVIWGAGPVLSFPTASDDVLGSDKYAAGISGVVLTMPGSWVVGALASQIWDVAGDDDVPDVNRFSFQYFINYNFPSGWYFTSAPIITANWEAEAGEKWTIPIGGGLGKIVKAGKVPLNINTQIFYNLEKPRGGADWEWRFQVQMMFPK